MTTFVPEQAISATKASVDTAFGLAGKALQGFGMLLELNAQTVKAALAEARELVVQPSIGKGPQDALVTHTKQLQVGVQKTQQYWKHVTEIVSGTQAEFEDAARLVFKQSSIEPKAWLDSMSKSALPGGDAIAAFWKSSLGAASQVAEVAYTAATKPPKRVVETAVG
ncbi:phasin family protein [Burkholderia sp. Ac-20365]|uniref:phasin family protein n=1 Tax=Burkholderia sp. Ac-20365 TaxID=2703897 RepID=UPI00197C78ED|nr:phasin family protein [Burkholderia sp. Ac-20365]MBN3761976.1 phasin family protein [Burkholderia sp. Ac-20365]